MKMKPKLVLFVVILVFLAVVIIQNAQVVSLRFLFWKIAMSGAIFYPLLFGIGVLTGWVGCWFVVGKKKKTDSI